MRLFIPVTSLFISGRRAVDYALCMSVPDRGWYIHRSIALFPTAWLAHPAGAVFTWSMPRNRAGPHTCRPLHTCGQVGWWFRTLSIAYPPVKPSSCQKRVLSCTRWCQARWSRSLELIRSAISWCDVSASSYVLPLHVRHSVDLLSSRSRMMSTRSSI